MLPASPWYIQASEVSDTNTEISENFCVKMLDIIVQIELYGHS